MVKASDMIKKSKIFKTLFGIFILTVGIFIFLIPNLREYKTKCQVNQIVKSFETSNMSDFDSKDEQKQYRDVIISKDKAVKNNEFAYSRFTEEQKVVEYQRIVNRKETIKSELYDAMVAYNQELIDYGQQIMDAWDYEQVPDTISSLNQGDPIIGYIEIPDMGTRKSILKLPLYSGASPEHLEHGAAVLSQTSMPIGGMNTNTVIVAHRGFRGRAFFQRIDQMKIGSMVYVTNPWETLTYKVTDVKIVSPNDTKDVMIKPNKDMLTLISCHPYVIGGGPERYLVFCERVNDLSTTLVNNESNAMLNQNETVMESDDVNNIVDVREPMDMKIDMQKLEDYLRIVLPVMVCFLVIIMFIIRLFNRLRHKNDIDDFQ